MKKFILAIMMALPLVGMLTSCDEERDVIIIEEALPLKTDVLYIVGDATPAGWNIDDPFKLTKSEENKFIFTFTGHLNTGEFKAPLSTGNWGCNYVMPMTNGCKINHGGCAEKGFQVIPNGNPDFKWYVEEAGDYILTFDLMNYTIDVKYTGN